MNGWKLDFGRETKSLESLKLDKLLYMFSFVVFQLLALLT